MSVTQLGFFGGEWCDCDWSPADGAFVFARLERPGIVQLAESTELGTPSRGFLNLGRWGLYLRAAADGAGNVCVVLQDGRDPPIYPAIVVLFPKDGSPREIACPAGPAWGQNAVEVQRAEDEIGEGWWVYVATGPATHWLGFLSANGKWLQSGGMTWPPTSQGFADGPFRVDDVRLSVPGMVCPSTADGLSIGQNGDAGPDRLRGLWQGTYFTALAGVAFEPHLVSNGQGVWMGCARTPQGAALFSLAPPFVAEDAHQEPPTPPVPPVPVPLPPTTRTWELVPDGTLVTGALETLLGTNPCRDGDIICLHKNTFPECEWRIERHADRDYLLHWADASRIPGDRGWWIEPAPVWAVDVFRSGDAWKTENATLVDFHNGKTNRWRQTNTLYGIVGGGVMIRFDPRFPGQYDGGYEKQWTRTDGWSKWQYLKTPISAKGKLPWGDPGMDIVVQEVETGPPPPSAPLPFVPCPRPRTTTPPPPTPPKETHVPETATPDQIARYIGELNDPILLGARQRYRDEVLLPRDRVSAATDGDGQPANHADMMTGGAAMFFDRGYVRDYLIARVKGQDVMGSSVAGLIGAAGDYRKAVGIVDPQ